MTKVEAIKKVMKDNDGVATWEIIYNEIETYYPKAKSSKEWQAGIRGVLYRDIGKNFKRIGDSIFALIDYNEKRLVIDTLSDTTKDVITSIRIGQNLFRKKLLKVLRRCPVTKIDFLKILVASHIKPWATSNNEERLDIYNGFVFSPTVDKLFDQGFISFSDNKELLVSKEVSPPNKLRLGIKSGMIVDELPIKNREIYLEYHRKKIFRR